MTDPSRFADWDAATLDNVQEHAAPPRPDGGAVNDAVEYGDGYVAAYFDVNDRPVRKELAAYVKVWDVVDGRERLRILERTEAP